jgi:hypothetical protein
MLEVPRRIRSGVKKRIAAGSAAICVLLCMCSAGHSQTIATIGAIKDNTLYQTIDGSLSNGQGMHMFVGVSSAPPVVRRALVQFTIVEHVPLNATIVSAVLTLHLSKTSGTAGQQTIELHRILAGWGEGPSKAAGEEGSGAQSATGDATWLHRSFNTSLWTNPGGDFAAAVSGSQSIGDPGVYNWGSSAQMVSDVQGWLADPATNFGWLLRATSESGNGTSKRFDTREDTTLSFRPVLTVTYTVPAGIEDHSNVPSGFALLQNYPNPFNPSTTIRFNLAAQGYTTLKVYDLLGGEVATLLSEERPAGEFQVTWKPEHLASGSYVYRLTSGGLHTSRMLLFVK